MYALTLSSSRCCLRVAAKSHPAPRKYPHLSSKAGIHESREPTEKRCNNSQRYSRAADFLLYDTVDMTKPEKRVEIERQIRDEFAHVPATEYYAKRLTILQILGEKYPSITERVGEQVRVLNSMSKV
jgi:hypothetical protein